MGGTKNHYGWFVLFIAIVLESGGNLGRTSAFSPFLNSMCTDLNISKNSISATYTFANLFIFFTLPYIGRLFDCLPSPLLSSLLVISFSLFLLSLSYCADFSTLLNLPICVLLFFGFAGIRTCLRGFEVLARSMVAIWFKKKRKWATFINCLFTTCIASSIPWFGYRLSKNYNWQQIWQYEALAFICLTLPLCLFLRKRAEVKEASSVSTTQSNQLAHPNFFKSYNFWLFCLIFSMQALENTGLAFHLIPICTDFYADPELILKGIIANSFLSIGISFVTSSYFEKWGPKKLFIGFCLSNMLYVSSALLLSLRSFQYIFLLSSGFVWGINYALLYLTWPYLFGIKNIGSIHGFTNACISVGSALGPLFFSYCQSCCSYRLGFYICFVVSAICLLGMRWVKIPKKACA